jgi:hypothetical protein
MDSRFNPNSGGASGGGDYEEISMNPSQGRGGERRGDGDHEAFSINPRQGGGGGKGSRGRKYDKIARDGRPVWEHIRDRARMGLGNPAMFDILTKDGYI